MQHALLVVRINIGQQTLVRALSTEPAQFAQHVLQVNKKPEVVLDLLTLHVQHALLVIRINIGQQTLVRALSTEPAQFAQHVLQVNKKPEVALDLL